MRAPRQKSWRSARAAWGSALGGEDRVELLCGAGCGFRRRRLPSARKCPAGPASVERFLAAAVRTDPSPASLHLLRSPTWAREPGVADALAKECALPDRSRSLASRQHLTAAGIQALLEQHRALCIRFRTLVAAVCASATGGDNRPNSGTCSAKFRSPPLRPRIRRKLEDAAVMMEPDPVKRESLMQRVSKMNVVQRLTLCV